MSRRQVSSAETGTKIPRPVWPQHPERSYISTSQPKIGEAVLKEEGRAQVEPVSRAVQTDGFCELANEIVEKSEDLLELNVGSETIGM